MAEKPPHRRWFAVSIVVALITHLLLFFARSYTLEMALISGVAVGALVLMTLRAVFRLRHELGRPPFEREK